MFEAAPDEVRAKLQVVTRFAEACLRAGMPERSVPLLSQGTFTPWEGEGHVRHLWKEAHMQLGHRAMAAGNHLEARDHFEEAASFPRRFNVGKPERTDDADALFWAGWCSLQMGDREVARRFFKDAAHEMQPPNAASAAFKARASELL
jgi:tetratricopeptide (TPR) repeat protein